MAIGVLQRGLDVICRTRRLRQAERRRPGGSPAFFALRGLRASIVMVIARGPSGIAPTRVLPLGAEQAERCRSLHRVVPG
jgi:hypothetical protein